MVTVLALNHAEIGTLLQNLPSPEAPREDRWWCGHLSAGEHFGSFSLLAMSSTIYLPGRQPLQYFPGGALYRAALLVPIVLTDILPALGAADEVALGFILGQFEGAHTHMPFGVMPSWRWRGHPHLSRVLPRLYWPVNWLAAPIRLPRRVALFVSLGRDKCGLIALVTEVAVKSKLKTCLGTIVCVITGK